MKIFDNLVETELPLDIDRKLEVLVLYQSGKIRVVSFLLK